MAPCPSIVFTEFGSRADPVLRGWADFRSDVLRMMALSVARAEPTVARGQKALGRSTRAGRSSGIWRLIASNNREVARSLHLYDSFAHARDHVLDLQRMSAELEIHVLKGPSGGQHGWVASFDDIPVISCGRWYSASSLARESAGFSVVALQSAVVPSKSRPTHPIGGYTPRRATVPNEVSTW